MNQAHALKSCIIITINVYFKNRYSLVVLIRSVIMLQI